METERFDQIATACNRMRNRRETLRLFGDALAGAGALAAVGAQSGSARGKHRKKGHRHHHHHHNGGGGGGGVCLDLGADCGINSDCCSGKCSTEVITTCRKLTCVETGPCASDVDCCGGYCLGGCCQGVC